MEIDVNSWHARFYEASYNNLSDSSCVYFWNLVVAFIALPFSWFGYVIPSVRGNSDLTEKIMYTMISVYLVLILLPFILGKATIGDAHPDMNKFLVYLWGLLMIVGCMGIALLIDFIRSKCINMNRRQKTVKTNLVKERWKAFKGRYCPKIEWKY